MTNLYEFRCVVIIEVEASNAREAQQSAEEVAEELNSELPTGATMIHKDGHVETNFERQI